MFPSIQEHLRLGFHLLPNICVHTVQNKDCVNVAKILHFISCEERCALQSKSKYYTQNKTLSLHSGLVKGWQVWTGNDALWADKKGMKNPHKLQKGWRYPPERQKIGSPEFWVLRKARNLFLRSRCRTVETQSQKKRKRKKVGVVSVCAQPLMSSIQFRYSIIIHRVKLAHGEISVALTLAFSS